MRCAICGTAHESPFTHTKGPQSGRIYLTSKATCCNAVTVLILEDEDPRGANLKPEQPPSDGKVAGIYAEEMHK